MLEPALEDDGAPAPAVVAPQLEVVLLGTANELLRRGRERSTSPFHDFRLSRGVTWLEPGLHVEATYSEVMEGRLRDPVYRGIV